MPWQTTKSLSISKILSEFRGLSHVPALWSPNSRGQRKYPTPPPSIEDWRDVPIRQLPFRNRIDPSGPNRMTLVTKYSRSSRVVYMRGGPHAFAAMARPDPGRNARERHRHRSQSRTGVQKSGTIGTIIYSLLFGAGPITELEWNLPPGSRQIVTAKFHLSSVDRSVVSG